MQKHFCVFLQIDVLYILIAKKGGVYCVGWLGRKSQNLKGANFAHATCVKKRGFLIFARIPKHLHLEKTNSM